MCGIFGYYDQQFNSVPKDILVEMGNVINHRGPDGLGLYDNPDISVGLGNQRLSILDIEHGDQPFYSEDQSVVVVQNGEIFNHVELAEELAVAGFFCKTHCDTEVILKLYEKEGIDGLNKLNGMFAIAIYDKNIDSVYLIRDRVGEKPFYYSFIEGRLVFASEIKSMLSLVPAELNKEALLQYLSFNYVPMPETMFKNIQHVKPGHYLKFSRTEVEEVKWWDLSSIETNMKKSESEWISEFNHLLDDAVRIRLRSDVPFGAFLSGGVDSSTVVGLMAKHMESPVKTYCIGFNDKKYDESSYAQVAASRFNTAHKLEIVEPNLLSLWPLATYHCDQPHGDVSFLPTYKVAKLASSEVKMVLTGDGADELFAGYDKYKSFFSSDNYLSFSDTEFQEAYAKNIELFSQVQLSNLIDGSLCDADINYRAYLNKVCSTIEEASHMDRINQVLYLDTQLLLSGNNLVKPDRMGMAVSIENRAPFLDYRVIELAFSMPGTLKLKENETKYIYKKAVTPLIGNDLAYRKKQMFTVPVGDWFKTTLKPLCVALLLSNKAKSRNLFNYSYVEQLIEDHSSGKGNYTREIRALMAFEYWCLEFLDKN
jgi:asparagine synthase (glutamine-hydrolysing)